MAAKIFKDKKLKNVLFRATNLCHKIIQINKIMISIKFRIMLTPKGEGKKDRIREKHTPGCNVMVRFFFYSWVLTRQYCISVWRQVDVVA